MLPRAPLLPSAPRLHPPVLPQISLESVVTTFEASILQQKLKQLKAEQRAGKKGTEEQLQQAKVRTRWAVTAVAAVHPGLQHGATGLLACRSCWCIALLVAKAWHSWCTKIGLVCAMAYCGVQRVLERLSARMQVQALELRGHFAPQFDHGERPWPTPNTADQRLAHQAVGMPGINRLSVSLSRAGCCSSRLHATYS